MESVIAVAMGGAVGSTLRYLISIALQRPNVSTLPWGTLTVNVVGALALGFITRYFIQPHTSPMLYLALTVGLCGGFTTFSTLTLEVFTLVERGAVGRGILYAGASVVLSYAAFVIGHLAGRTFRPLP